MEELRRATRSKRAWFGVSASGLAAVAILGLAACAPVPPPVQFTVTSALDGRDAVPGDGVCEVTPGAGDCSLRAAIDEANANVGTGEVVVRFGARVALTADGVDDTNAGGDLDIDRAGITTILATAPSAFVSGWNHENAFEVHRGALHLQGVEVAGANGPAVRVHAGASAMINASTLRGNFTGLWVDAGGGAVVAQSTFTQDRTAIHADGPVVLGASTIVHTSVAAVAGPGPVEVIGSIIGAKDSGNLCMGTVVSRGWNVSDQVGCGLNQPTDRTGSPLQLIEPQANATPGVYEPSPTSPAFDLVAPGVVGCAGTDQLGHPRPLGDRCEAGSIETVPASTFHVDSGLDQPDEVIDGHCRTAAGACTLRAAVAESNTSADRNQIILLADVTTTKAEDATPAGGSYDLTHPVELDGNHHAISGGGLGSVLTTGASSDIHDVSLTGGVTDGFGGGLAVSASTRVSRSTISGNRAVAGGGIYVSSGATLELTASTVATNTATGGTIDVPGHGLVTVEGAGGGLYADDNATVALSTFTGNSARHGSAVSSGTLFTANLTHVVSLRSVTGVDNADGSAVERTTTTACAPLQGCTSLSGGEIQVVGSALANPQGSCTGVSDRGWNVGCSTGSGSAQGLGLEVLRDNGGPTETQLPDAGSTVLDVIPAGTAGLCDAATATDQRGSARPVGPGCEAGAVERL